MNVPLCCAVLQLYETGTLLGLEGPTARDLVDCESYVPVMAV